jgi:hypothetical protein
VDERAAELLYRHKVMRLLQDVGLLTRELMDRTVPDCLVTGFEELIDSLDL